MLPLGVVAYPSVVGSTTPLGDTSWTLWRKPKASTLRRAWSNRRGRFRDPASTPNPLQPRAYSPAVAAQPPEPQVHTSPVSSARPKHVPILIPHYAPTVAPGSPCNSAAFSSSRTSTIVSSERPSLSSFPLPGRKSFGDSSSVRARHVEIVIPQDWRSSSPQPPTVPVTLPSPLTPSETPTPAPSQRELGLATMARQTPNTSRTNTIDSQTSAPSPAQLYPDTFRNGKPSPAGRPRCCKRRTSTRSTYAWSGCRGIASVGSDSWACYAV